MASLARAAKRRQSRFATKSELAAQDEGVFRVKSVYPMAETLKRLKMDIAAKGIPFFSEIDQSKLASDAGVKLRPSTLLVFGNPPLGTLFLTSEPAAGLAAVISSLAVPTVCMFCVTCSAAAATTLA